MNNIINNQEEIPVFFPNKYQDKLLGILHCPLQEKVRDTGIVICHPILEEKKSTYKLLRDCAKDLCSFGFYVFRFDLSGCGDSEGDYENASVNTWVEDTKVAVNYLTNKIKSIKTVGLIGLRLGATIAAFVREESENISFLCLWSPIIDGKQYVKINIKRKLVLELWKNKNTRQSANLPQDEIKGIDIDGYYINNQLIGEMEKIDLIGLAKRDNSKIMILSLKENNNSLTQFRRLGQSYQVARNATIYEIIGGDPFWDYIGLSKWPELIRITTEWFLEK